MALPLCIGNSVYVNKFTVGRPSASLVLHLRIQPTTDSEIHVYWKKNTNKLTGIIQTCVVQGLTV